MAMASTGDDTPVTTQVQLRYASDAQTLGGFNQVLNATYIRSVGVVSTATEDGFADFFRAAAIHVGEY